MTFLAREFCADENALQILQGILCNSLLKPKRERVISVNNVDFLGSMYYENNKTQAGFLYGSTKLSELRNRKVIVLGTGKNSFSCTNLLHHNKIEIEAYCANNNALVGKHFFNKKILSPFDVFSDKDCCIIVATDDPDLNVIADKPNNPEPVAITDQLAHNGMQNVSYFFQQSTSTDFENAEKREVILKALNCLINNEYTPHIHKNLPLGITIRLTQGLEWWSDEFNWLCDDSKVLSQNFKALDIGPGFGFVSLIVKLLRPDCKMDWLCLSLEEKTESSFIDTTNKLYPVTKHYGIIEDPGFNLSGGYDVIIMTEVFEHFACAPLPTLKKIAGLLNKDGRLYLSTPNWEKANMYRSWKEFPAFPEDRNEYYARNKSRIDWMDLNLKHTYFYEQSELMEIFDLCGLKAEKFTINNCNNYNTLLVKK